MIEWILCTIFTYLLKIETEPVLFFIETKLSRFQAKSWFETSQRPLAFQPVLDCCKITQADTISLTAIN